MGILEWYVVSVIVCFVVFNLTTKLLEGFVTVGDFITSIILSAIPFVNFAILLWCCLAVVVKLTSSSNRAVSKKLF